MYHFDVPHASLVQHQFACTANCELRLKALIGYFELVDVANTNIHISLILIIPSNLWIELHSLCLGMHLGITLPVFWFCQFCLNIYHHTSSYYRSHIDMSKLSANCAFLNSSLTNTASSLRRVHTQWIPACIFIHILILYFARRYKTYRRIMNDDEHSHMPHKTLIQRRYVSW